MKFTLSWLKQHLDTSVSLDVICDTLTAIGLEVENVDDPSKALAPFIIAHVISAEKHPQADRLQVALVDTGKEKLQVVCGAPNCRAGLKVVLARPGDVMPDTGEALKKGVIRGVESQGMLCAADELKIQIGETSGIIELPLDAPLGEIYARYAQLDDPVIEINLTPNRPDCAGVRGIARDLAAAGLGSLKPLDVSPVPATESSRIKVVLAFPEGDKSCPLFVGRLIRNIKNIQSPEWMRQRLLAIGQRPISALVDITNYMTFDLGRPLHVFDASKIRGNLWVRPAKGGETLKALNGKDYILQAGMTAIGDDTSVLSLAGIMGGEPSSCDENTTDVYLEAACFDPGRTARTGRALQLSSDARYRFERGIDPAFTIPGAEIATKLVLALCGTPQSVVGELEIAGAVPSHQRNIILDPLKCKKHTGVEVAVKEQETILTRLGFSVTFEETQWKVVPPSWRPDVEGAADLVEEIIRIKGYHHIEGQSLPRATAVTEASLDPEDTRIHHVRRALASQGLMECVTWSFMPGVIAALFGGGDAGLRLLNPISSDLDVMRPTLIGNHVAAAKRNADRGFGDVELFEIGPLFKNATPEGQVTVAAALRAGHTPRHWALEKRPVDAFDAKADALAALTAAGAPVNSLQVTTDAPPWYHPGRSGALRLGPNVLAYFGEIHPHVLAACQAEAPMVACEIFLNSVPQSRNTSSARPLLKAEALQPVLRDFAFVVAEEVSAAKLVRAVRDADKTLIRDVSVFDVYEGHHMEAGKKSVALSVVLQPIEKSLTDPEIEALSKRIAETVSKTTGATLRN